MPYFPLHCVNKLTFLQEEIRLDSRTLFTQAITLLLFYFLPDINTANTFGGFMRL
jgi:hypothetical protein